jgi:hypothetical protein
MRDRDIRQALTGFLRDRYAQDTDTLIVGELGLCRGAARVDMAVVNGSLHGFEIKSERDTLERLPGQAAIYGEALDNVTIVCSSKHLESVRAKVPDWWGIIEAEPQGDGVALRLRRPASNNPTVNVEAQSLLLWRDEALHLLQQFGLAHRLLSKPRAVLCRTLAERVPAEDLAEAVRATIKARAGWKSDSLRT